MPPQIRVQPEDLRLLGTNFTGEGDAVASLMSRLDSQLRGVDWAGDSATRFRTQWEDEFRPVLVNLADALGLAAGRLNERADSAEQYDRT
jgi:WXG100 family type VII secretion target